MGSQSAAMKGNIEQLRELLANPDKIENLRRDSKVQAEEKELANLYPNGIPAEVKESNVVAMTAPQQQVQVQVGGAKSQLQALSPRHRAIMRACLKGFTVSEIAEISNLTPKTVSLIVNSDIFKRELETLQAAADDKAVSSVAEIRETIRKCSGRSVQELEAMLKDRTLNPRLRADIAWDFLDRDGHGAVKKEEVTVDFVSTTINAFARRKAQKAAQLASNANETIVIADIPRTQIAADEDGTNE